MDWDEPTQTELYLVDKKANIKEPLQMVTVPVDLQRVGSLEQPQSPPLLGRGQLSNKAVAFQVSCMEKLD